MPEAKLPHPPADRSATSAHGMVAAAKPEASLAGVDILRAGGNAVDAAVAAGFALGVVEPNASGLGGGGFMIIRLATMAEAVVIDFRETAPAAARPSLYRLDGNGGVLDRASTVGGLAVAVPGEAAGLLHAFEHYGSGRVSRPRLLQPAIQWATGGYTVTPHLAGIIRDNLDTIRRFPACAAIYLKDGLPPEPGDLVRNPDLARTLDRVAKEGKDAIHLGEIARRIAGEVRKQGGILTVRDLAGRQVEVRRPVVGSYRGFTIMSAPLPSCGGTHLIQVLNILERTDLKALGRGTPASIHLWAESMRQVFADHRRYLAGTQARHESSSTTSLSVLDDAGNMATITKTINEFFGSFVLVPGCGFIMNNTMDDFEARPGSANSIQAGKCPLSNMSPTIVLDPQGRPFMTLGSPGATRVWPAVAQVISNVIDLGMPLQEAIAAPRCFQMDSGALEVEGRFAPDTLSQLAELGHTLNIHKDWDLYFGGVQAVLRDHPAKALVGGADPRRDGQAVGC